MADRVQGSSVVDWVPVNQMRVTAEAQRDYNPNFSRNIAEKFNPDLFGRLTLNFRGGWYWIIDGQHRWEAVKLMEWTDAVLEAEVFTGLTEAEEAEMFLGRNHVLRIRKLDEFRIGVKAGRPALVEINRIVNAAGFRVGGNAGEIKAVGTLVDLYAEGGSESLARVLNIIRETYGEAGLVWPVLNGLGLFLRRYPETDDVVTITKIINHRGGVEKLLTSANGLKRQTGSQLKQCVAAAVVDILNRQPGGKKLKKWWAPTTNQAMS